MATTRIRVRVEELVALFGERTTTRLIRHCGGRRVPRSDQYLRVLRQKLVVYDWLHQGYSQADLAAKYQLSPSFVKRIITRHLNQRRRRPADHAN